MMMDRFHTVDQFRVGHSDAETTTLSTSQEFLAVIKRSRSRRKKEGGIASKDIRRRLGLGK